MTIDHQRTSHHIIQNFEASQLKNRSLIIFIVDWLTSYFGSIGFFLFNIIFFVLWLAINTKYLPIIPVFDPFPFIFLTMAVSLEAIFLSVIVLMSQNKQSQISSLREELDMQVNLIAEREITMTLKVLKKLAQKFDLNIDDKEFEHMTEETDIPYIQRELQTQIDKLNRPNLPNIPEKIITGTEKLIPKI